MLAKYIRRGISGINTLDVVYNLEDGKWIYSVRFSPNGELLATGDKDVRLYSVADGSIVRTFSGHTNTIFSLDFSSDGKMLASGSQDRTLRVWNVADGNLIRTLEGSTDWVRGVAFSPDDSTLALDVSSVARMYQVSDGEYLYSISPGGQDTWVTNLAFSPDGYILAVASGNNNNKAPPSVRFVRSADSYSLDTLEGHTAPVKGIAFSPDGTILATGSSDQSIRLWDVSNGNLLNILKVENEGINRVAFSPDGTMLVSAPDREGEIRLWGILP